MGVLYVECKKCCKKKCECHHHCRRRPETENAVMGTMSHRHHHKCGCNSGASRYYRYDD